MRQAARRRRYGGMGEAGFHPDSWDFDASTYRVRDAGEETMAQLASFYGGTIHDLNMANITGPNGEPWAGDPGKYGAYVGTEINMPKAFRDRALQMPCPSGFSRDQRGFCVPDVSKGGTCPAGWATDANGQCYDPAKGGGQTTDDNGPPAKWSTTKKLVVGSTVAAAGVGILYTLWKFSREAAGGVSA